VTTAVVTVLAVATATSFRTNRVEQMSPATPATLGEAPPPSPDRFIPGEGPPGQRRWQRVGLSGNGVVMAYQQSVFVLPRDTLGPLYVWDQGTGDLTFVSDNVEPGTRPALSMDGRVVVFAEERDSMTKRDGVNADPDVHRIVRWTAATGPTPLTGFDYEDVPAIALSGDGQVIAFAAMEKATFEPYQTFLIQGPSAPTRLSPPSQKYTGSGWSSEEGIVSVSGDGGRIAFMQWQEGRSMVYLHDVGTGRQRALDQIVPGVTSAEDVALSADGKRLAVRLIDDSGRGGTVTVVDVDSGVVLRRSRPMLHPDAHTENGRYPVLSGDGDLLVYRAPGKSDGMSLDAGELFKADVIIAIEVRSGRAKYVDADAYDVGVLADGRLVVGKKLYRF
jgi:hypothetical protein